ncbi:hypothetical protein [Desulfotignum phosphitoxidans]|jgi:hypothetical protein|uniref:PDGLE domain-containing protein n=1 Tax=Desulfotignum phosphitoxidans DSM 13687 TaxID=1286635 RepID=S0G3F2_9BACT|nr:hypothetical protein [Desulfotignum phosphitoxidans]EMS78321.1 hypothetical protein Dpo_9c01530 [Desulfotignum phosphitoxidans DSM 13687]
MEPEKIHSRKKGWLIIGLTFFCLWGFATVVGPWGEKHIPVFNRIVEVIKARDIDSGAYFYTEIEASYSAERELQGGIKLQTPDDFGFTPSFILGIVISLTILIIGFKTLPSD